MKPLLSIFLVLHLMQTACLAQDKEITAIDTLVQKLKLSSDDSSKLNLYSAIIEWYTRLNPKEGSKFQVSALALAQKINQGPAVANLKQKIGRLNWTLGNFNAALKFHTEALDFYLKNGDQRLQGFLLTQIAQDYLDDGRYNDALQNLSKALEIYQRLGDKLAIASIYDFLVDLYERQGNILELTKTIYLFLNINEEIGSKAGIAHASSMLGYNFQMLGNNAEALKYFSQCLKLSREIGDRSQVIDAYICIGNIYRLIGKFPEALSNYADASKVAKETSDVRMLNIIFRGVGNVYYTEAKYPEALRNYVLAEQGFKSYGQKQALATLYSEMAIVYTLLHKYDLANKSLVNALELSRNLASTVSMSNYYKAIALLDSATGKWKNAYDHYRQYTTIKDSTFDRETLRKLIASQIQYQNEKNGTILKAEQEKKDVRAKEKSKRQQNILISSLILLGMLLIFSIVAYRQRDKIAVAKKRSDQLVLDKELLLREIHHRVKNNLEMVSGLLGLQIAQISDPNTRDAMQQGRNRVHSIGIVHQKLYQRDNPGAIEMKDYFIKLSESIINSFGADGRITMEIAMEKLDVDIDTAVPLGLIVNELLTNTLKYAFPEKQHGQIKIKLEKQVDGSLHLEVSDNGVGKSGLTHGTGFGGQLISLLTRQLNGSMKEELINGTRIFFEFSGK